MKIAASGLRAPAPAEVTTPSNKQVRSRRLSTSVSDLEYVDDANTLFGHTDRVTAWSYAQRLRPNLVTVRQVEQLMVATATER